MEIGRILIEPTAAGAQATIPEGYLEYHKDTDKLYKSDGSTKTELGSGGGSYTDEMAQDAVGGIVDATLVYSDATPSLGRAALTGDVTAAAGSNATVIANDAVTYAKIQNVTDNRLLGRSAGSSGDVQEITTGSGIILSSGVLSSNRIYGLLDVKPTVDTPDDEFNSTTLDPKWTVVSGGSGTVSIMSTGTTLQVYDLTTRPGWLLTQVGKNTGQVMAIRQDYTLPDGNSIVMALSYCCGTSNAVNTNNGTQFQIGLNDNDTSIISGNYFYFLVDAEAGGFSRTFITSSVGSDIIGQGTVLSGLIYLRIFRVGLVYHCFASTSQAPAWIFIGTKTMPSASTNIWIQASSSASITGPAAINGVDWIRQGTNNLDPW